MMQLRFSDIADILRHFCRSSSGFRILSIVFVLLLSLCVLPFAAAQETGGFENVSGDESIKSETSLPVANTTETEKLAYDLMNKGVRCSYAGNYTCAVESFDAAHRILPNDTSILYNHAVVLVYMKKYEDAVEKIDAAILLDPGDAYLWYAKGTIQKTAGDFAGSGQSYDTARQLDPEIGITVLDLYPANIIVNFVVKNTTAVVLAAGFGLLGIYIWFNERRR
ncbi:MAG TPA: tetratricopeptide repeat protein [Methanoregulaceae archaeon]|nr:tetratricopeptide repeat protein [Methanoregulaceae archaeon]HPD76419.1 tetratricopeptide repeat protein [Methanoregulaceae archaeon]